MPGEEGSDLRAGVGSNTQLHKNTTCIYDVSALNV